MCSYAEAACRVAASHTAMAFYQLITVLILIHNAPGEKDKLQSFKVKVKVKVKIG